MNPNPANKEVPDCVVRAISIALGMRWLDVYDDLCRLGRAEYDMPNSDVIWGRYLYQQGFEPFLLPESCPRCFTVRQFCQTIQYLLNTRRVTNGQIQQTQQMAGQIIGQGTVR